MNHRSPGELDAAPRSPRYPIRGLLGRGAVGVVYRARDVEMGRDVALKTFRQVSPEEIYYLKREFRALADLSHPNLAQLYDLFASDEQCFFTMELVDGSDLLSFARDTCARDPAAGHVRLREAFRQLALGLHALHQRGQLHRDVKPSNVMVEPTGRTVVLDFGLVTTVRRAAPGADDEEGFAGTLGYIAPEAIRGVPPSPASDWYSVGVLLYECLTGALPDRRSGDGPPAPRQLVPDAPEDLCRLAADLLQDDPAARPSGAEVLGRLGRSDARRELAPVEPDGDDVFVGRRAELERLRRAFEASRRGACVTVRVEGPSGIGKSSLLERFGTQARRDEGALVLHSRCHPQESLRFKALDGVVDQLSRFLLRQPRERLERVAPANLAALMRVFPVLAQVPFPKSAPDDPMPGVEPQEIRRRAFGALRSLLVRVASEESLIVWIDDLQWGDLDSAPLLRALLRAPAPPSLLLLLSYRTDERETSPLLADLDGSTGESLLVADEHLSLAPLRDAETRELIDRRLGPLRAQLDGRVEELAAECEGSPFFIDQLARSLLARHREPGAADAPRPLDLAHVVNERVWSLPEPARRIVEVAAVAGGPVSRSLLLRAAGFGEDKRTVVASLRSHSILRHTTLGGEAAVQPYHDRIRESVLAELSGAVVTAHHRSLATVLEASGRATPDELARHFHGAGELARASDYAAAAGDRAAEALAFLQAADFYARSLEWGRPDRARTSDLLARRAAALANAGHGGEAAPLYLEAAEAAEPLEAGSLRRRAAEQFMVSGRIDEGLAVLRPMLAELGTAFPSSGAAAIGALVLRLAQLGVRGTRYQERAPAEIPHLDLGRIDACHAAVKGLVMVDPLPGAYFAVRSLLLALQSGEVVRIGRSLCVVGASMIPAGPPVARWAERLLEVARQLAERHEDPYLLGMASISTAQISLMNARWRDMLERCDAGVRLLSDRCQGVAWERNIGSMGALRALEELGRVRELTERALALLHEAEETGDLYAQVTARLNIAYWRIAEGDPSAAREQARAALALWAREGFLLQHLYAMRVEACCDLYEGRPEAAWQRVCEAWPEIRRSGLLRHALLRTDARALRARVAVALAARRGDEGDGLLRSAGRDARRLVREGRADAVATGRVVEAAVAGVRGQAERARRKLDDAIRGFEQAGMALQADAARRRLADWQDDGAGRADVESLDVRIRERGVRDPARWLPLVVPAPDGLPSQRNSEPPGVTPK